MSEINVRHLLPVSLLVIMFCWTMAHGAELGVPVLSGPIQQERFFETEKYQLAVPQTSSQPLFEPQFFFSRDIREADSLTLERHVTQRVHGEAGGKLKILGDVSLSTVAKLPLYTHDRGSTDVSADVVEKREFMRDAGRLSWRSEVGVPLGEKVNLNFFYDNSILGRVDRPGVDEKEEKFGTRFIYRFK